VYPGCQEAAYPGSSFCCKAHKLDALNKGAETCLWCRAAPRNVLLESMFCSKGCGEKAEAAAPVLLRLNRDDKEFKSVEHQFTNKWEHDPRNVPFVQYVYMVYNAKEYIARYRSYKMALEIRGKFIEKGLFEGNELRRFHGTQRECNVGDNGNKDMCASPTCPLCCIMKTSFDITKTAAGTFMRYGNGIYTSATSSKADSYSKNIGKNIGKSATNLKAMLLTKVAAGEVKKVYTNFTNLKEPPRGYDSVVGEPANFLLRSTLRYDELVVYSEHAIVPSYLVIYKK